MLASLHFNPQPNEHIANVKVAAFKTAFKSLNHSNRKCALSVPSEIHRITNNHQPEH
jgi:hypothetical protein